MTSNKKSSKLIVDFNGKVVMSMKQSKYAFETIKIENIYALLARENRQLSFNFAALREKSALFSKKDCFECLSPHRIAG